MGKSKRLVTGILFGAAAVALVVKALLRTEGKEAASMIFTWIAVGLLLCAAISALLFIVLPKRVGKKYTREEIETMAHGNNKADSR